jgi:hemerythrin-like metal-binding protein
MYKLFWMDEYSVGVKELDDQHESLLNIINLVAKAQQEEYDANKFSETINDLIRYAYFHFSTEERYMFKAKFPDFKSHVLEHITFIQKTLYFSFKIENGDKENLTELAKYLKEWYISHVLKLDRDYIPFLNPK